MSLLASLSPLVFSFLVKSGSFYCFLCPFNLFFSALVLFCYSSRLVFFLPLPFFLCLMLVPYLSTTSPLRPVTIPLCFSPPSCIFLSIKFFNRSLLPPSDLSIEFDAFIKTTHSIKSLEMSLI